MSTPRWSAYLGIDQSGRIVPYISERELNPIGTRFEKEKTLPGSCYLAFKKELSPEEIELCIRELQTWLDTSHNYNSPKKKKK